MFQDEPTIPGKLFKDKLYTFNEWNIFNLDEYYSKIKNFTFKSIFINLTKTQLSLFKRYLINKSKLNDKELVEFNKFIKNPIEDAIKKLGNCAFIRLSTRSPKDAVDKLVDKVKSNFKPLYSNSSLNDIYIEIRRAFYKSLKVKNADEALELLSYSSRIMSDLIREETYSTEKPKLKLILREFYEFEFSQMNLEGFIIIVS